MPWFWTTFTRDRSVQDAFRQVARQFIERWFGENDIAVVTTTGGASEGSSFLYTQPTVTTGSHREIQQGASCGRMTLEQIELRERISYSELVRPETLAVQLRSLDQEHAFRARTALSHLQSMSEILGNMEGQKKVILYIGEGISYDMEDFYRGESADMVGVRHASSRGLGGALERVYSIHWTFVE